MTLRPRLLQIPFERGLAQQMDVALMPEGVFQKLENWVYVKDGRLGLRNGFTALTMQDLGGGALSQAGVRAATWRNERLIFAHSWLLRYITAEDKWDIADGPPPECSRVAQRSVARLPGVTIRECATATGGGYTLHAWVAANNYLGMRVVDEGTGATIWSTTSAHTAAEQVRCFASGNFLFCGFVDTAGPNVEVFRFNTTLPNTPPTSTHYTPAVNLAGSTSPGWDVHVTGSTGREILLVYCDAVGGITWKTFTESMATTDTVNVGGFAPIAVGCFGNTTYTWAAYYDAANGLRAQSREDSLANPTAVVVVDATLVNPAPIVFKQVSTSQVNAYWSQEYTAAGSAVPQPRIADRTIDSAAAMGAVTYRPGFKVASKPHKTSVGAYMWGVYDSTAQTSVQKQYVLVDVSATSTRFVARVNYSDARGFAYRGCANFQAALTTDSLVWTAPRTYTGKTFLADPETGIDEYRYNFDSRRRMMVAEMGGLCVASGMVSLYDGDGVAELGFLQGPDFLESSLIAGGLTGTYNYVACYEYVDNAGNKRLSAVSPQITVAPAAQGVRVLVPYLRLTNAQYSGGQAIKIYRTTASGTLFYECGTVANSASGNTIAVYDDTTTDAELATRPQLYTGGGQLDRRQPPGADAVCRHADRVWFACGDTLWFSHPYAEGQVPQYTKDNKYEMGAEISAIASLDDALVAFSEAAGRIWAIYGDGPNDLGVGTFNPPHEIPCDAGCIDVRSVVTFREGVAFQSERGIEVLPRGLTKPFVISGMVEDELATYPIVTSAVNFPEDSRLKFTVVANNNDNAASAVLVFDYDAGVWSTETSAVHVGLHTAANWGGQHAIWNSNTQAAYLQGTGWADPSAAFITAVLTTGRMAPGGLSGLARFWAAQILGEQRGSHQLKVETSTDGGVTYPAGSVRTFTNTGAAGTELALSYEHPVQECTGMIYRITCQVNGGAGATEGCVLNALTPEVGIEGRPQLLGTGSRA